MAADAGRKNLEAVTVLLLGNDPGDRQWSMLEYGEQLRQALAPLLSSQGNRLMLRAPDTRRIGNRLRRTRLGRTLLMYASRYFLYPRLLSQAEPADLIHILDHGNSLLIRRLNPARTVVTCHDLIPLVLRNRIQSVCPRFSETAYRDAVSGLAQAAAILADSHSTKRDIISLLGCPENRIHVVPLAIDPSLRPPAGDSEIASARQEFGLPDRKLLLHVGQSAEYKNVEGILRCLSILVQKGEPVCLVKAGAGLSRSQWQLVSKLNLSGRVVDLGPLPRDRLNRLYHAADMLLFPSWYEGFGLPPLEAMASGLPVIASDRGSLQETAGDAALRVRPDSPEEMAEAVRRILSDRKLREDLRVKGPRQAAQFTWEKTARQTLEVYKSVLACYTFDQKRRNPR